MPVLKMLENRSLVITKLSNIYQDENNAEQLKILLPKKINNVDLTECYVYLNFLNQTGAGNVCDITEYLNDYSDANYAIEVPMYRMFTYEPGIIQMWIKVVHFPSDMVAKTNEVSLFVKVHKETDGTIPEHEMSLISGLVEKLESTATKVEEVDGKLEEVDGKVQDIISGQEQIVQPMLISQIYEKATE